MIKNILVLTLLLSTLACQGLKREINITEIDYQNIPHFKVETPTAIYYINKESGGCTSVFDIDGNDWIMHSKTGTDGPTISSDSDFRGMPNLVFRESDDGVGHPVGRALTTTKQISNNKLYVTSNSGLWEFVWTFHEDYATLFVEKADPSRAYWFLYEGPVAGRFDPHNQYWANNNDGVRIDIPCQFGNRAKDNWQWVYFGDKSVDRCFYVSMVENDTLTDFFAYMGNNREKGIKSEDGMNVFGFGRSDRTQPLLTGQNKFIFGFYEKKLLTEDAFSEFKRFIDKRIENYR